MHVCMQQRFFGSSSTVQAFFGLMETRFVKQPAAKDLDAREGFHKQKLVWDWGWQTPSRKGAERKHQLWLYLYDCEPWPMPGGPCSSNCRVVMKTYYRHAPVDVEEIIVGVSADRSRRILRLQLPEPYGRLGLHVLAYWIFWASRTGRFKDFASFQASGEQVDHGPGGHPHVLDWRVLQLLPSSGPGSNASQGASLRYNTYAPQGGLAAIVATSLRKKPAAARATLKKVLKKPAGKFLRSMRGKKRR